MRFLFSIIQKALFFIIGVVASQLYAQNQQRESSAPFISGDTFRCFADYIYDETSTISKPRRVQYGDIIFVKTDMLKEFFIKKHPYITNPYVLITHNSDLAVPGRFAGMLSDSKILSWYGQNIEGYKHPKLIHLPIGLANRSWEHGSIEKVSKIRTQMQKISRDQLVYLNISVGTYPKERTQVYEMFKDKAFCLDSGSKPFEEYLKDLASCRFVLSPRGNGIDCHRTWEALYLGSIPILKTSDLDPLYEGLPVVIVEDWGLVTEEFLEKAYNKMLLTDYNFEKLVPEYWYNEFSKYKRSHE